MKEIIFWLLDKIVNIIPSLFLRVIYPSDKVARDIRISLRGDSPIVPSLSASVPHIDIYLEVTNFSNLNLILDRILIDLWFGQPTINGAILHRYLIPARKHYDRIHFRTDLTSHQIKQIEPYLNGQQSGGPITLSVTAYFESRVGLVEAKERFERRKI